MHIVLICLDLIKNQIESALPDFKGRVWRRRLHQLADRDLPAILIQFDGETISESVQSRGIRPISDRVISFSVVVADKLFEKTQRGDEGESIENKIYEHIGKIEYALLFNSVLENQIIKELRLVSIDLEDSSESDRPLSFARMQFRMTASTRSGEAAPAPIYQDELEEESILTGE